MNYALIENGVVTNIIWLHPRNADAFPGTVALNDIPVMIGDTYADGAFHRNGERVLNGSEITQAEKEDMQAALALLGVTMDE